MPTKEEIERQNILNSLDDVRAVLKVRGEKLSEEQYQTVKQIFHYVPTLDFVPKALWIPLSQMLKLKEIPKDEKLLIREITDPPCCIILSGKFRISLNNNPIDENSEKMMLEPGMTCGNFQCFSRKHWQPMDVTSIEEVSTAAVFNSKDLEKLLAVENSNAQFKSLLAFLTEAVPGFEQLSGHSKERLCRFFKEVTYLQNKEIIKEGLSPASAYIIKEGICSMMSKQNPLFYNPMKKTVYKPSEINESKYPSSYSLERKVNNTLSSARTLRGNMSLSVNISKLTSIGEKEWIGEEILIMDETPDYCYDYSVIAKTKVVLLEISKDKIKKFPIEILDWFKRSAHYKLEWIKERKFTLSKSVKKIYKMDPLSPFLDEALRQVTKRFPQATPQLTNEIHKQHFLVRSNGEDLRPKTARQKVALLPEFNYLRMLINAKRESQNEGKKTTRNIKIKNKSERIISTASKPNIRYINTQDLLKSVQVNKFVLSTTIKPAPIKQEPVPEVTVNKTNALKNLTLRPKNAKLFETSKPFEWPQPELYRGLISRKSKKVYLETAATFRMSYDKKASLPIVFVKEIQKKIPRGKKINKTDDARIKNMKIEVEGKNNTFKVGLKNIKLMEMKKKYKVPNDASATNTLNDNYQF